MELKPSEIRYTQAKINTVFDRSSRHSRRPIGRTLDDLCEGRCSISDIPRISVCKHDGKWYTRDNRRLWVFKQLERLGKCTTIPVDEVSRASVDDRKFSTSNGGTSVYFYTRWSDTPSGTWYLKPSVVDIENNTGSEEATEEEKGNVEAEKSVVSDSNLPFETDTILLSRDTKEQEVESNSLVVDTHGNVSSKSSGECPDVQEDDEVESGMSVFAKSETIVDPSGDSNEKNEDKGNVDSAKSVVSGSKVPPENETILLSRDTKERDVETNSVVAESAPDTVNLNDTNSDSFEEYPDVEDDDEIESGVTVVAKSETIVDSPGDTNERNVKTNPGVVVGSISDTSKVDDESITRFVEKSALKDDDAGTGTFAVVETKAAFENENENENESVKEILDDKKGQNIETSFGAVVEDTYDASCAKTCSTSELTIKTKEEEPETFTSICVLSGLTNDSCDSDSENHNSGNEGRKPGTKANGGTEDITEQAKILQPDSSDEVIHGGTSMKDVLCLSSLEPKTSIIEGVEIDGKDGTSNLSEREERYNVKAMQTVDNEELSGPCVNGGEYKRGSAVRLSSSKSDNEECCIDEAATCKQNHVEENKMESVKDNISLDSMSNGYLNHESTSAGKDYSVKDVESSNRIRVQSETRSLELEDASVSNRMDSIEYMKQNSCSSGKRKRIEDGELNSLPFPKQAKLEEFNEPNM